MGEHNSQAVANRPDADGIGQQALQLVGELQAELNRLRKQLAWSNRLGQLGTLTAALAHETNNLLTPVRSYAQLALANPENPELTEQALNAAVAGTDKTNRLLERVLGLASPSDSAEGAGCYASEAVDEALQSMAPAFRQGRVTTMVKVPPTKVGIDALMLEQVLINLLTNACQAMAEQAGKRTVRIESQQQHGRLVLSVTDNGPGIPEPVRERIFEPFVSHQPASEYETAQAAVSNGCSTSTKPGSGLGLSICKEILASAGGQILLDDGVRQGCSFQIDLPLGDEEEATR